MATITVDLTTLTNYNSLPDGVYTIKCVAKGLGIYTPSNMSSGASSYRKGTYTISTSVSNGTFTGDTSVRYGLDASVTITPNSGYGLPSTVSISGNVGSYSYNSTTGVILLTNVTGNVSITVVCTQQQLSAPTISLNGDILSITDVPDAESYDIYDGNTVVANVVPSIGVTKGDLITMNVDGSDKQFRVLNVNGTNAEVVMMTSAGNWAFASSGQIYAGSNLDNYLNITWYNQTLNATARAAIVDKTFTQDSWYGDNTGNPDYSGYYGTSKPGPTAYTISLDSATFGAEITRHVYALSVQDVLDYILDASVTDGQFQNYNLWKLFWNDEVSHTGVTNSIWLCSANASSSSGAFYVNGRYGFVGRGTTTDSNAVRPAFTIDLTKITWSKVV